MIILKNNQKKDYISAVNYVYIVGLQPYNTNLITEKN